MIKKLKAEKQNIEQLPPPVPDPPGGALSSDTVEEAEELDLQELPEKERILALVAKVWESQPELSFGQLMEHVFLCRPAGMGPLMGFLSNADFLVILERVLTTPVIPVIRSSVKPSLPKKPPARKGDDDPEIADRFAAPTGRMPAAQF
jgi:hypothetical protein